MKKIYTHIRFSFFPMHCGNVRERNETVIIIPRYRDIIVARWNTISSKLAYAIGAPIIKSRILQWLQRILQWRCRPQIINLMARGLNGNGGIITTRWAMEIFSLNFVTLRMRKKRWRKNKNRKMCMCESVCVCIWEKKYLDDNRLYFIADGSLLVLWM